jgi:hypothetical protein
MKSIFNALVASSTAKSNRMSELNLVIITMILFACGIASANDTFIQDKSNVQASFRAPFNEVQYLSIIKYGTDSVKIRLKFETDDCNVSNSIIAEVHELRPMSNKLIRGSSSSMSDKDYAQYYIDASFFVHEVLCPEPRETRTLYSKTIELKGVNFVLNVDDAGNVIERVDRKLVHAIITLRSGYQIEVVE